MQCYHDFFLLISYSKHILRPHIDSVSDHDRLSIGIPMCTNCASQVADFLFCYDRDFMLNQSADSTEAGRDWKLREKNVYH